MTRRSLLDIDAMVLMGYAAASATPVLLAVYIDRNFAESYLNHLREYQATRDFHDTAGRLKEWRAAHPLTPDHTDLVRFELVTRLLNMPYGSN